jgi:hypothetical protein
MMEAEGVVLAGGGRQARGARGPGYFAEVDAQLK